MERLMRTAEDLEMPIDVTMGDAIGVPEHIVAGTISANIAPGEEHELQEAVERHVVPVSPNAPGCCIDGRNCVHTMNGEPTEPRPSVAGGPVITAFAAAELTGWFGANDTSNLKARLERIASRLEGAGIKVGGHIDEGAVASEFADDNGAPKTGCGANDKFTSIMDNIYECPDTVANLSRALLGEDFDEDALGFTRQVTADWDPKVLLDVLGAHGGDRVEVLQGTHAEVLVVFNYREDTTIDRDALNVQTGKQVFVVDMWYINKLARALAQGPDANEQYTALQHAMVAYQIGTYVTLCDGSQRAAFVK